MLESKESSNLNEYELNQKKIIKEGFAEINKNRWTTLSNNALGVVIIGTLLGTIGAGLFFILGSMSEDLTQLENDIDTKTEILNSKLDKVNDQMVDLRLANKDISAQLAIIDSKMGENNGKK